MLEHCFVCNDFTRLLFLCDENRRVRSKITSNFILGPKIFLNSHKRNLNSVMNTTGEGTPDLKC